MDFAEAFTSAAAKLSLALPFKFTQKACVFETGDSMYTVMWETNLKANGYVTYTYNSKQYTVYDQTCGNIRTHETIHSVRIPKEHLDNNVYRFHSQFVGMKFGYDAIKGKTLSSDPVSFKGYHNQEEINLYTLSDIHGNLPEALNSIKNIETPADLIVLNGDISSTIVFKKDFTEKILGYAYELSKGEIPVVYTRGNHETRGEYASCVAQNFRINGAGMYFTFNYGPLWAAVLDSGEDKPDDHKEYNGLVDFQTYLNEQTDWLSALSSDTGKDSVFRLAFSHMPDIDNRCGNNWAKELERLGVQALFSGHTHTLDLHSKYNEGYPFYTVIEGGTNSKLGYVASVVTLCKSKSLCVKAYNASGKLAEEYFEL